MFAQFASAGRQAMADECCMSTLLAALALPAVKPALAIADRAVTAARQPFAAVLQAAADCCRPESSDATTSTDPREALADSIAARLQQVLGDAGSLPGETLRLHVDDAGRVTVEGGSPAASAVQRALDQDESLRADLAKLAATDGVDTGDGATLEIEAGLDDRWPQLRWS